MAFHLPTYGAFIHGHKLEQRYSSDGCPSLSPSVAHVITYRNSGTGLILFQRSSMQIQKAGRHISTQ